MGFIERYLNKSIAEKITEEDVNQFIKRGIEESINLDYKRIEKYEDPDDLADKIAAFANSDGGLIILGVNEISMGSGNNKKILPGEITWGKENYKKEDLDNRLFSKIKPWINGVQIRAVRKNDNVNKEIYLIDIPRSNNTPHWSSSGFYKRKNFSCEPMSYDEVKSAFLNTHIYKDKIIELIVIPLYSDINNILVKFKYTEDINIAIYNDINVKYRYYLDNMDNKIILEKIDAFYKYINERNKYLTNCFIVSQRIIEEVVEDYQLKQNPKKWAKPGILELRVSLKRTVGVDTVNHTPLDRVLIYGGDIDKYYSQTIQDYGGFTITSSIVKIPGKIDKQLNFTEFAILMKECTNKIKREHCFKKLNVITTTLLNHGNELKNDLGNMY